MRRTASRLPCHGMHLWPQNRDRWELGWKFITSICPRHAPTSGTMQHTKDTRLKPSEAFNPTTHHQQQNMLDHVAPSRCHRTTKTRLGAIPCTRHQRVLGAQLMPTQACCVPYRTLKVSLEQLLCTTARMPVHFMHPHYSCIWTTANHMIIMGGIGGDPGTQLAAITAEGRS